MISLLCLLLASYVIHSEAARNRIIGGTDAEEGSFPYMAMLRDSYWDYQFCGGSLVGDGQWVLTARHCIRYKSPRRVSVVLGAHAKTNRSDNEQVMAVRGLFQHPDIDVGLIQLYSKPDINEYVAPIELSSERIKVGNPMTVTGWGMTEHEDWWSAGDVLQQIQVPIVANEVCDPQFEDFPYPYNYTKDHEICAGYAGQSYTNVCHGDSGGPGVFRRSSRSQYKQYGVVSWGTPGCPEDSDYAVFADVSAVYAWVTGTISDSTPPPECTAPSTQQSFSLDQI